MSSISELTFLIFLLFSRVTQQKLVSVLALHDRDTELLDENERMFCPKLAENPVQYNKVTSSLDFLQGLNS